MHGIISISQTGDLEPAVYHGSQWYTILLWISASPWHKQHYWIQEGNVPDQKSAVNHSFMINDTIGVA